MNKMLIALVIAVLAVTSNALAQQKVTEKTVYYDQDDNLYTGNYIERYPNGKKRIEISILNGLPNGKTILYFENGKINEVRMFKRGLKDGVWETFNIEEVKTAEAGYRNDKKEGKWLIWDEKGVLRFEMHYRDNERIGVWKTWDAQGNLIQSKDYSK